MDHTKETVEHINDMAAKMHDMAYQLSRTANRMQNSGDLTYAGEVAGCVANLIQNLRLDLLVIMPLRAKQKDGE